MNEKGFLDIFKRYTPEDNKRELLLRARSVNARMRREPTPEGDGKGRVVGVEVDLYFDSHEDPELIYEIEDDCIALYSMETFKILPHFPPSEYNISRMNEICTEASLCGYFDEIALEAALCGAITNGFFNGAEYSDDGETLSVAIPYFSAGVDFVKSSGTEETLSNILRSRYGLVRKISIIEGLGAEERHEQGMNSCFTRTLLRHCIGQAVDDARLVMAAQQVHQHVPGGSHQRDAADRAGGDQRAGGNA